MALQKQPVSLTFAQGVNTKTDAYQVPIGSFLTLVNSVFTTEKRLTKRNGFPVLTQLPDSNQTNITTLNDTLVATGSNLYAYNADNKVWLNHGLIQPVQINTTPLVRNSASQTAQDASVAANNLVLTTYHQSSLVYYQVADVTTGQSVVPQTLLTNAVGVTRVFVLANYFIIVYVSSVSGTPHLQYMAVPVNMPSSPRTPVDISTTIGATTADFDGYVANETLYIAWADNGPSVRISYLTKGLILSSPVVTSATADLISVTADITGQTAVVWVTYFHDGGTSSTKLASAMSFSNILTPILAPAQVASNTTNIVHITSSAQNGVNNIFYELANNATLSTLGSVNTDYVRGVTITNAGTVGSTTDLDRGVGLASKSFITDSGKVYMWVLYGSSNQPTYFLIDSTGAIYSRLAYSNGGGFIAGKELPNVTVQGETYYFSYLFKDFLTTVNKTVDPGAPTNAIYTQTGVNITEFTINSSIQYSSEIADTLHLTGGMLWDYDGVKPVENNFHVWPDNIGSATSGTGGAITAQQYNYSFTYEWTDNTGKLQRSSPSIPVSITTTGSTSSNTLQVPNLRLTAKINPNPVRIVGYRWSVAQPVFYQFTSVSSPVINDPTTDYATIVDTLADSAILGNAILYTTGGVIENISPPPSTVQCLFKNRLFLVDAEDQNLIWFSKVVIEDVPVEMSDLLTIYVAPTTGSQFSTGAITALSAMDDKLIVFKRNAIYYITGSGPDNTGANNDFSDAIFISSSVGCINPDSIVLMQDGIMFQSDKGIWRLGRDLSTLYVGAPVEGFNTASATSALVVPGTTQVRFGLDNTQALMYDYFFQQWGTFNNIRSISGTLYNGLHTYLTPEGKILQEKPGTYADDSSPVLMSFTTAWTSLAGLQGFERFYSGYLLGTYKSPFKLQLTLAYDYKQAQAQSILVTPSQTPATYGSEASYGSGPAYGGQVDAEVFEARFFPAIQKCETIQVGIQEVFDPSFGTSPGEGLTLSGLDLIIGVKRGFRTQRAGRSFG